MNSEELIRFREWLLDKRDTAVRMERDCRKMLDNPNMSEAERRSIRDQLWFEKGRYETALETLIHLNTDIL